MKKLLPLLIFSSSQILFGCTGTSENTSQPFVPQGGLEQISVSSISEYPAHTAGKTFISVYNHESTPISGLIYELVNNINNSAVKIDPASAATCASIPGGQSCNLALIFADTSLVSGAIMVQVSQNSSSNSNIPTTILQPTKLTGVGLVNLPPMNLLNGANGAYILAPAIIAQSQTGPTPVIVNLVVNSQNIGTVNTLKLVDATPNHNPLSFASVISGNNEATTFSPGQVLSFLLNIPNGTNQVSFQLQTSLDSTTNISYSSNVTTLNLVNNQAVLSILPSTFALAGDFNSQQIYVLNSGNVSATNLNLTNYATSAEQINISPGVINPCSTSLSSGYFCSYTTDFDTTQTILPGNALLNLSYNNGSEAATTAYATVAYSGVAPGYDLSLSSSSYSFTATTAAPSNSSLVQISNNGSYTDSNINFTLPAYFSLSSSGTSDSCQLNLQQTGLSNNLAPGEHCSLFLNYINPQVTPTTVAQLGMQFSYADQDGVSQAVSAPAVNLIYTTLAAQAELSFLSSSVDFGNISANASDSTMQNIQLINNGQAIANNISLALNDSSLFKINSSNCTKSLDLGESCNVNIKFGPSNTAGSYAVTLSANYVSPGISNLQTTSVSLNGQSLASGAANLQLTQVSLSKSVSGDGYTNNSAFLSPINSPVVLTYQNQSKEVAKNFSIDTSNLSNGYTVAPKDNACSNVTLAENDTCMITLKTPAAAGAANLDLNSLSAAWSDGIGSHQGQTVAWHPAGSASFYTTAYVSLYAPAIVQLSTPQDLSSAIPGAGFELIATLTGGDQVPEQTITPSATGLSFVPASCKVSSLNPRCSISVHSTPTQAAGSYPITVSAPLSQVVPAEFPLTLHPGKVIFISAESYTANLKSINASTNGIQGADFACNNDLKTPTYGSWHAMVVDGVNRSAVPAKDWVLSANTLYTRPDYLTPIGITESTGVFNFPLINRVTTGNYHPWSGLVGSNIGQTIYDNPWDTFGEYLCNTWSSSTSQTFGVAGSTVGTGSSVIGAASQYCSSSQNLYCVQQ